MTETATPIKPKTSDELQADLDLLAAELASCEKVIAESNNRQARLTASLSNHVLGYASSNDVLESKVAVDQVADAVARRGHLMAAVDSLKQSVSYARGAERQAFCQSIKDEFIENYALYKAESLALWQRYRMLQKSSVSYQGMTGRALLTDRDMEVHLPCCHNPEADIGSSIPTGRR